MSLTNPNTIPGAKPSALAVKNTCCEPSISSSLTELTKTSTEDEPWGITTDAGTVASFVFEDERRDPVLLGGFY